MTPRISLTLLLVALAAVLPVTLAGGVAAAAGAPPRPSGVSCAATGAGSIDVSTFSVWDFTTTELRDAESGQTWTLGYDDVGSPYDAKLSGLNPNKAYKLQIRYTDSDGTSPWSAVCAPVYARPSVGNLVLNPSAAMGVKYWHGANAALAVLTGGSPGVGGPTSIKVARTGGTRYGVTDFAAEALPTVVSASAKSYEAAAWVKAASPSAVGKPVTIALHERAASGRTVRVTTSPVAVLTRSWRQVWVTGRVVTAGDTLGIRVQQREAAAGNAMAVDDLRMHPYGAVVGIGTAQTERTVDPNVKRATAVDMTPCSPNDPLWINCDAEYDLTSYDAYVDGRAGGAGSATLRGVIYADGGTGPSTLVAATRTVVVKSGQAARWVRLPLSAPVELGSRVYWFGYQVGGSSRVVRFYGDDASYCDCGYTSVGVWNADGFDNGPSDRFGPSHGANFNTMVRGAGGR